MNASNLSLLSLAAAVLMMLPSGANAQSSSGGARNGFPNPSTVTRTLTPPRPAGLGGNLPPGRGGPNPSLTRRASNARSEISGLAAVCGPGGALSAQEAAGNPGRARARALVCPG